MKDTTGVTDSTGTNPSGNLCVAEGRRGPSWRGMGPLHSRGDPLVGDGDAAPGGSSAFRSEDAAAGAGGRGSGAGRSCCPPADAGK